MDGYGRLAFGPGEHCLPAFRPERATLDPKDTPNWVEGSLQKIAYFGNSVLWFVEMVDARVLVVETPPGTATGQPGDRIRVGWSTEGGLLLKEER